MAVNENGFIFNPERTEWKGYTVFPAKLMNQWRALVRGICGHGLKIYTSNFKFIGPNVKVHETEVEFSIVNPWRTCNSALTIIDLWSISFHLYLHPFNFVFKSLLVNVNHANDIVNCISFCFIFNCGKAQTVYHLNHFKWTFQ